LTAPMTSELFANRRRGIFILCGVRMQEGHGRFWRRPESRMGTLMIYYVYIQTNPDWRDLYDETQGLDSSLRWNDSVE
ncbi:MAG: hypothetical protein Q8P59_14220, partial [Dehalococcoidia bacterium]|nr:hypothetical protein [Dehalococcoidia bacterium]